MVRIGPYRLLEFLRQQGREAVYLPLALRFRVGMDRRLEPGVVSLVIAAHYPAEHHRASRLPDELRRAGIRGGLDPEEIDEYPRSSGVLVGQYRDGAVLLQINWL